MHPTRWSLRACLIAPLLAGALTSPLAQAVPSFARQTSMSCEACHTVFPELNHFGRMFKANGYTLENLRQVRGITAKRQEMLALTVVPPLSVMMQVSETQLRKPLPDGTVVGGHSQSGTVDFPQQFSIFYAGKIAPHFGGFIQLTYSNNSASVGIYNTDLRFSDNLILANDTSLVYGLTLNNNPTVQDLWNSTPSFGFPFASSNARVSPQAGTQIDGAFAQSVAGICAYVMWNEALYAELGLYRSAKQGAKNPITGAAGPLDGTTSNVLKSSAPYFWLAYEYNWARSSLEAGVYGATFKLFPGGGTTAAPASLSGPSNEFRDIAEDNVLSVSATRIHEAMTLGASSASGASANPRDDLTTVRANVNYFYQRKYGGS